MSTQQPAITKRTFIYSAVGAVLVSGALLCGCAKDPALTVSSVETTIPESGPVEVPPAQTTETDVASVEYTGTMNDNENAVISFKLTNKTDKTVVVKPTNIVTNGADKWESSTGSKAAIKPGESGEVDITLTIGTGWVETGSNGLVSLTADLLVLEEGNESNQLGAVPINITL